MADDLVLLGVATPPSEPKAVLEQLQAFARERGGWAQLFDAEVVLGRDHVVSAYEHALRAFAEHRNSTASLEMEVLLYVSGQRQISKAIQVAGARQGRPVVVALGGGLRAEDLLSRFQWERDDSLIEPTSARLRAAGFSKEEIAAAGENSFDLILERVARVDLIK